MSANGPAGRGLPADDQRFRDLFHAIDEGYCLCEIVVDARGVAVDYRFLEVNALFEEMTGLVDPVGRTALELVPGLERVWVDTYARVGLGRERLRFSQESAAMGRWFDVFAVPIDPPGQFAIVFKDDTVRHDAEQALRENHAFVSEVTALMPGVLYVYDLDQRRNVFTNSRTGDVLGYTPTEIEELGDRFVADVLHPQDAPRFTEHLDGLPTLAEGQAATVEYRFRHRDGTWRWFESRDVVLHRGADGRARQILGIASDITARKADEAALAASASTDAYRARLAETLRLVDDPVEVQAGAESLLAEHLRATRALYVEVPANVKSPVAQADDRPGRSSVAARYRLEDYGAAVMAELRAGRTVVVSDVGSDERLRPGERDTAAAAAVASYVIVPLLRQGRPIAALAVHDQHPRVWSEPDIALVAETAELTRSAVDKARQEAMLQVQHARAELVAELLSELESERSVPAQLQRLVDVLVPAFADFATVEAPDRPEPLLALAHRDPAQVSTLRALRTHHRIAPEDASSVARAAAGEAQLISVVTPALRSEFALDPDTSDLLARLGPRSHLAVPLDLGGERGALMVGLTDPGRGPFGPEDRSFLDHTAQRVAVILTAARLRQREHDIAVRLQHALLPDQLIQHPDLAIEARYQAAGDLLEVGGDWYDTFSWPDGHLGVIVGDVVGHNLESAAAMGRLRAATAALARHVPPSPAALLDALERFARGPDGTTFVTAVCVVVDPASGRLVYSSAGHPPALVLPPGRPAVRLDDAQGLPICVGELDAHPGARPEAEVTLAPGTLVILYSDGLIERRGEEIEVGIERFETLAVSLADQPLATIADQLVADTAPTASEDDMVVACLRFRPGAPASRRAIADPDR